MKLLISSFIVDVTFLCIVDYVNRVENMIKIRYKNESLKIKKVYVINIEW